MVSLVSIRHDDQHEILCITVLDLMHSSLGSTTTVLGVPSV